MEIVVVQPNYNKVVILSQSSSVVQIVKETNSYENNNAPNPPDSFYFTQADLSVAGTFTLFGKFSNIDIYDNTRQEIMPDNLTIEEAKVIIDLSSFTPIEGTYEVRVD